jgi:hypothetical protein
MDPTPLAQADTLLAQASEAAARARRPESTYRLQLHAGFTCASWASPTPMPRRT